MFFKFSTLIFLSSLILIFQSCENESVIKTRNVDSLSIVNTPDQNGWNVMVYFIDSTYTKAILYADHTRVYQQRMETLLNDNIKVEFLSKATGKRISLLTADSAKVDDRTKNMLAKGRVVVISDSTHTRLETTLLQCDNATQKLYSTEFVKIIAPNETLQGYGFESDQNLTNYKIFKVSGVQK